MSRRSRGKIKQFVKDKQKSQVADVVSKTQQIAAEIENLDSKSQSRSHIDYSSFKFPKLVRLYDVNYKKLFLIPIILLIAALLQISYQYATTGDFLNRGISLKGGTSITFSYEEPIDILSLEDFLTSKGYVTSIRLLENAGVRKGFIVDADLDFTDNDKVSSLLQDIKTFTNKDFTKDEYSTEGVGSSLGDSFFRQMMIAILLAFIFMGVVVFLYFRTFVPSFAVILASFSDIVITLAIVNLLGIKISSAGIAAFLMLIGYSVDTDILLSTRVLKRQYKTVFHRVFSALKTGFTMSLTTLAAVGATLILTQSDVIRQIMLIIFIGLLVDIINTWIQNVAILRFYCEKKGIK